MENGLKRQGVETTMASLKLRQNPIQASLGNKIIGPPIHQSRTSFMFELEGVKLLIATALQKE